MLSFVVDAMEGFFGHRLKREFDCKRGLPCVVCGAREACVERFWDGRVIVNDEGKHEYDLKGGGGCGLCKAKSTQR